MDKITSNLNIEQKGTMTKTCDIHGEYSGDVFKWGETTHEPKCQKCSDEKEFKRANEEKNTNFRNSRDSMLRSFSGAGIPPRFKDKTFDDYITSTDKSVKALSTCKKYANNFNTRLEAGGGIILCGAAGTGKTHLASAIVNKIKTDRYASAFMSAISTTRHVKSTYGRDSNKSESEAISDFLKPDLLVIDEVGVQFGTDAEKIILFEIINMRYQHVKPTILISNLALDELSEYIGERVVDRMHEGGGAVLSFDWDSYRRQTT